MNTCLICKKSFTITAEEQSFYQKIGVSPRLCLEHRRLNRLVFRNDHTLYSRKCDLCQKTIIATYDEHAPFPVYCPPCWWSDQWSSKDYGRDLDLQKPFFEQWNELNHAVPHISLWQIQSENSNFAHDSSYNKDCYMLFGADYNRDCYFGWCLIRCQDAVDCAATYESQRLYECVDCSGAQFCMFSQLLNRSSNCYFCFDLVNCHDCFGSSGLRNKQYFWFNQQLNKEEYEKRLKALQWTHAEISQNKEQAYKTSLQLPRRYVQQRNCEGCTGSYLGNCKDVKESFDADFCRDVSNSLLLYEGKDIHDCEVVYHKVEIAYNSQTLISNSFRIFFSYFLRDAKETYYSTECYNILNVFGCVGLHKGQYYILNKQYSKAEYEKNCSLIMKQMQQQGQWGEFFPMNITPFAYNETAAYDYMPRISREDAEKLGLRWKELTRQSKPQTYVVPERIEQVPDSILNEILACKSCGKNYRIVAQELRFYRQMKIPIPAHCFDCRHLDRLTRRGPRLLFDRNCSKCTAQIRTTYAPGQPEIVYCEKCYLAAVY